MIKTKMEYISLFEVFIAHKIIEFDNELLLQKIKEHQKNEPSVQITNNGGYQGHRFFNEDLLNIIRATIPRREDKQIDTFDLQSWVNINSQYSWNDIHNHQENDTLISGIYYVKTPKDCGNLRLYDPRFFKGINAYDKYYYEGRGNYITFTPREGMIIFFPPWLYHMVEPNMSKEERVSVAFNIMNCKFKDNEEK